MSRSRFIRLLPVIAAVLALVWGFDWLVLKWSGPTTHLPLAAAFALLTIWGFLRAR